MNYCYGTYFYSYRKIVKEPVYIRFKYSNRKKAHFGIAHTGFVGILFNSIFMENKYPPLYSAEDTRETSERPEVGTFFRGAPGFIHANPQISRRKWNFPLNQHCSRMFPLLFA